MNTNSSKDVLRQLKGSWVNVILAATLLCSLFVYQAPHRALAAGLLNASFDADANGFSYLDDPFGTTQPSYASGGWVAAGGYANTGGLLVTLGGVNATAISGMSGGWSYTLNLVAAENGVSLSFRYKLDQTATYEYDEYTRMLVKVDGVQYGRGVKNYVDHIGGDGSSTQGNSSSFLPTTDWQQVEIFLGDLAAGSHSLILGGYNNKKDATDESTTIAIDDVQVTSGNAAPVASAAQTLADRVDIDQFLGHIQGVALYHDRCSASGIGCSTSGSTTNYMNALGWVESQLQAWGYTTVRHSFNYNGNTGTNLWATKVGAVTPTQMYMVSGHLDARSGGDGFDDDGSGVATVMEVARVLAGADVTTDKSVRFIFWDKEEVGLYGAYGYVQDRRSLQGSADEPTWLGLIQHDMVLYDHGAGTRTTAQSAFADMDVEWRAATAKETDSRALALKWAFASGVLAPDYPATAYNYSTNTDDTPFHPYVASISVRENRRILTSDTNAEWINPYYHTTNDIESSYTRDDDSDGKRDDLELGANTVRTTLGLVAELAGAQIVSVNRPPNADPQAVTTHQDIPVAITLTGSDPDSDPLTYQVASDPSHGALSGTAPTLTYTPAASYTGADSFTFTVNDGSLTSAPATVSLTVKANNRPPAANGQSVATNEDTPKLITLGGSDPDGDPLSYSVVSGPARGSLSGTAPNLTYTPAANIQGADSFSFKVNDGTIDSAPAVVDITINPVNDAPTAIGQSVSSACNTAAAVTLTGTDVDSDPLNFRTTTSPSHGTLTGTAPALTYTPANNYSGSDSFAFVVNDGILDSAPATVSISVGACSVLALPFSDDFESELGWIINPSGTDSASKGSWERADPQPTDDSGAKQLGDTVSGSFDLVTGALAGSTASRYDIDGGVTSIRSPDIQLPLGQDITLTLNYTFAHAKNASSDDFFRVQVVGASTATVLEVRGGKVDVDAAWTPLSINLNSFAGQTVHLLIEAADQGKDSLVEAGVDDLSITAAPATAPLLEANFDSNADGFGYADDLFRGTNQPGYASGGYDPAGGYSGGGLLVNLGGLDNQIILGISGGWQRNFTLGASARVNIAFWYLLTQSPDYDPGECSQALVSVDGVLYGSGTADAIAQICGNGNGGIAETTGWQLFSLDLGLLGAGAHTLTIGGYNNQKSYNNESSQVHIDQIVVSTP